MLHGGGPGEICEGQQSWVSNEIDNPESMLDPSYAVIINTGVTVQ